MVKKLAIIREIFKGDHNAAAVAGKLTRNQISALSGTLNKQEGRRRVRFNCPIFLCKINIGSEI